MKLREIILNYFRCYEAMNREAREIALKIRKGTVALEDADDVNYLLKTNFHWKTDLSKLLKLSRRYIISMIKFDKYLDECTHFESVLIKNRGLFEKIGLNGVYIGPRSIDATKNNFEIKILIDSEKNSLKTEVNVRVTFIRSKVFNEDREKIHKLKDEISKLLELDIPDSGLYCSLVV